MFRYGLDTGAGKKRFACIVHGAGVDLKVEAAQHAAAPVANSKLVLPEGFWVQPKVLPARLASLRFISLHVPLLGQQHCCAI